MARVLIIGAASDIAQALSHKYAGKGYGLVLALRNTDRLLPLKNDLEIRYGSEVELMDFDAAAGETHQQWVNSIPDLPEITICVMGYLGDHEKAQTDPDEVNRIIVSNYLGAISILDRIAEEYEKKQNGIIIGISSVAGERGRQSNYYYGSAKAGFTAYLSGLRNRLYRSKVHVLTVKPGFVNTSMTAGMDLPPLLTSQPDQVAGKIFKAAKKRKNTIYTGNKWRYIMFIIRNIPETVFKKLKL